MTPLLQSLKNCNQIRKMVHLIKTHRKLILFWKKHYSQYFEALSKKKRDDSMGGEDKEGVMGNGLRREEQEAAS